MAYLQPLAPTKCFFLNESVSDWVSGCVDDPAGEMVTDAACKGAVVRPAGLRPGHPEETAGPVGSPGPWAGASCLSAWAGGMVWSLSPT